tara:strand:- start:157527 stop:158960 length:1434 start_codon:yes stop_codon:yes gene_type:complete
MLPVIAIVGRPNVGKSTLFNKFTRSRDAIVGDLAGVTRDRQYGFGALDEKRHMIVDTGGMLSDTSFDGCIDDQVDLALEDATVIFFVVDAKSGMVSDDEVIAEKLRALNKKVYILVNKTDVGDPDMVSAEFYSLGFDGLFQVAAEHNRGVRQVIEAAMAGVSESEPDTHDDRDDIRVAIIGRPNVGKSTLTNRMLGEERMVVFDKPGTTLDSVESKHEHFGQSFVFIDTAGVRRKSSVTQAIEKFSIIKTLDALDSCHVALVLIDATEDLADQDLRILNYAISSGKAVILCMNKWDNLPDEQKEKLKKQLDQRLKFAEYVQTLPISALHGSNVGLLFDKIEDAYRQASIELSTAKLTEMLYNAQARNQPPLVNGRRIKLRYAHGGGSFPPTIIIHGSQAEKVPMNFQRYLVRYFMKSLKLHSTPLKLVFKTAENPYKHLRNVLNRKQLKKRGRLIKNRIEKTKRKRSKKSTYKQYQI